MYIETPIDYCEYKMDLLYDAGKENEVEYGYLVFNVVRGVKLNHLNVHLETNKDIHKNTIDHLTVIGEEVPLDQLKKLYQFLGFALNLKTEESEVA
tara:strand:+ start:1224 stop:1511 length:288 start_codon:yes stop_codon:yes gene_type:complete